MLNFDQMDKMLSEMLKMEGKGKKKKKGGRAKGGKGPKGLDKMMEGVFDFGDMSGLLEDAIADTLFGDLGMGNMSE
jgi:hypothetical protein